MHLTFFSENNQALLPQADPTAGFLLLALDQRHWGKWAAPLATSPPRKTFVFPTPRAPCFHVNLRCFFASVEGPVLFPPTEVTSEFT